MNVASYFVASEEVEFSKREMGLNEIRVTKAGVHTWYAVPWSRLTEFKQALRTLHNGARISGAIPYYTIREIGK